MVWGTATCDILGKLFMRDSIVTCMCLQVDRIVPGASGYSVVDDWDCMLNQTNIGQNNNKFYIIQMLLGAFQAYYVWNRWGRVVCPCVGR